MSRSSSRLTRRAALVSGAGAFAASAGGVFMPYLSRAADRPSLTHGIQSGDVSGDGAVTWARVDRPSRIRVEFATTESFASPLGSVFADALPESCLLYTSRCV